MAKLALKRHPGKLVFGLGRIVLLTPLVISCTGCVGIIAPRGPVGAAERLILFNSVAIMLAIVVPTIVASLTFAWWFRASNTRATYQPDFVYSGRIELIVWSIPVLTIMLLGSIAWIGAHDLDPPKPLESQNKTIEVQVVSLDWKWLFIYPEQGIATVNQLILPAGRPVHFALTSGSVMNAFLIPQLGGMIYTMNGMQTNLNLLADEPGDFHGLSSHYSGDGFSGMSFTVHAVPPADFTAWVDKARQSGASLDENAYKALAKQSLDVAPASYRGVAPDLFQSIVTQKLQPGPGPGPKTPSRHVSPKEG